MAAQLSALSGQARTWLWKMFKTWTACGYACKAERTELVLGQQRRMGSRPPAGGEEPERQQVDAVRGVDGWSRISACANLAKQIAQHIYFFSIRTLSLFRYGSFQTPVTVTHMGCRMKRAIIFSGDAGRKEQPGRRENVAFCFRVSCGGFSKVIWRSLFAAKTKLAGEKKKKKNAQRHPSR